MSMIARPYAVAAYEHAVGANAVAIWENFLKSASQIASDPTVMRMLADPLVSSDDLQKFFLDILKTILSTDQKNFLTLLAQNKRLNALPAVLALFQNMRAVDAKTIAAEVTSAQPLDETYRKMLADKLTQKFNGHVDLSYKVDPDLLGGVMIRAGDKVIDGSVRGKLSRLLDSF